MTKIFRSFSSVEPILTMKTVGTDHLSIADFDRALSNAKPGDIIIYAIGDLGYSCDKAKSGAELKSIRRMVWAAYERGEVVLTQRRRDDIPFTGGVSGASFEYRATKCRPIQDETIS